MILLLIILIFVIAIFVLVKNRTNNPKPATSNSESYLQEIERFHQLKEKGVLSQEEFDQQKKRLLGTKAKSK